MIALLFIASFLLTVWSWKQKRRLARRHESDTSYGKFAKNIFQWASSLFVVMLFYTCVLLILAGGWKFLSVAHVVWLEHFFQELKELSERYKPTWIQTFGLLLGIFLVSKTWTRLFQTAAPYRLVKKAAALVALVANIIFLFASFTLLGFDPGEPATTLAIHLQKEREEYGLLRAEVADAVRAPVLDKILQNITNTIPGGQRIPELIQQTLDEGERLGSSYKNAQESGGGHSSHLITIVRRSEARAKVFEPGNTESAKPVRPPQAEPPSDLSFREIAAARESLREFREARNPHVLHFLQQAGGKELALALPEGLVEYGTGFLDPFVEQFPLLKPVAEVLKSLASDTLEKRVEKKIDILTEQIARNPAQAEEGLQQGARDVANSVPIQVDPHIVAELRAKTRSAERTIADLQTATRRLEYRPSPRSVKPTSSLQDVGSAISRR
ncbi:MAG: hypothetical protein JO097_06705, partial [Acidobacteriaceae bacterium]|nr:hypothetical protein [Acidobacteriaceae bacterium]MBV9295035.1 hypothetical protein [Acidobacteriaceae bacterium]